MEIKLEKLKYEPISLGIVSNDVHVDFDYEEVEGNKIRMKLHSYIGMDKDENCRFRLNTQFLFSDLADDVEIEECIDELVQGKYLEIILFFENMGKEE